MQTQRYLLYGRYTPFTFFVIEVWVTVIPGILFNRQNIPVMQQGGQPTSSFVTRGERGENERFIAFTILFLRPEVEDPGVG